MQCDICAKKKATVHLTEIIDEQMSEMHLCEECAREKSVQMEQQFGLADLLAGLADFGKNPQGAEKTKLQCSNCETTYEDFRKFGRLGCSECYVADIVVIKSSRLFFSINNYLPRSLGKSIEHRVLSS